MIVEVQTLLAAMRPRLLGYRAAGRVCSKPALHLCVKSCAEDRLQGSRRDDQIEQPRIMSRVRCKNPAPCLTSDG